VGTTYRWNTAVAPPHTAPRFSSSNLNDMTRTVMKFRKAVAASKRNTENGKLFDSMHGTETNFTAKRCDVDSLVSTGTKTRAGHSGPRLAGKE
jgi:hypothetical protein